MSEAAALAGQIAEYDKKRVTSVDALNEALGTYGIPEIRKRVSGLRTTIANTENSLNAVDPSVTGRTSQSLVTEAQRQRMVANERAPIAEQLGGQAKALGDETVNLNENMQQANQLAASRVADYNTGRQALQSQYESAFSREQAARAEQQAREQAARDQANRDREFAESQRQFNISAASKGGSDSGPKAGSAESKAEIGVAIANGIKSMAGKDGYVSRATFASALRDFQVAGLGNIRKFWQIYGQYTNPKTRSQYANYAQR